MLWLTQIYKYMYKELNIKKYLLFRVVKINDEDALI